MHRRRAALPPHPQFAVYLALFLIFQNLLSTTVAGQKTEKILSPEKKVEQHEIRGLALNKKSEVRLQLRKKGNILVEYIPGAISRLESEDREQGPPDIILAAALEPKRRIFTISGERMAVSSKKPSYKCSQEDPCFYSSNDKFSVDEDSFYSLDDRYHVRLRDVPANKSVYISVLNYDRRRMVKLPFTTTEVQLKPVANAILRMHYSEDDGALCPGYIPVGKPVCAGNGKCQEGNCKCNNSTYVGAMCRHRLYDLTKPETIPNVEDKKWLGPAFKSGTLAEVPPYELRVFSWTQKDSESSAYVKLRVLQGVPAKEVPEVPNNPQATGTALLVFWIAPGKTPSFYLQDNPGKSSEQLGQQSCIVLRRGTEDKDAETYMCIVTDKMESGKAFRFVVYSDPRGSGDHPPKSLVLSIEVVRCGGDAENACPVRSSNLIPLAVLPVCIATIGITALSIILMLWLDRRHGFTSSVDRLTQKELDRMYPLEKLREGPRRRPAENNECLICLCEFERGDVVRKLHCEHFFHSECLDVSLSDSCVVLKAFLSPIASQILTLFSVCLSG